MISIHAKALMGMGFLAFDVGDPISARAAFEECAALSRQIGDKRMLSQVLCAIAISMGFLGDPEGAYSAAEESRGFAREYSNPDDSL